MASHREEELADLAHLLTPEAGRVARQRRQRGARAAHAGFRSGHLLWTGFLGKRNSARGGLEKGLANELSKHV